MSMYVYTHMYDMYGRTCVKVRGQLCVVISLLPPLCVIKHRFIRLVPQLLYSLSHPATSPALLLSILSDLMGNK